MSESNKFHNISYSQKNIERNFPKLFVKLKKNNYSDNNTELQKYLVTSRNIKPIKREKGTPFNFNKNSITKSTFYSKLESNSSTKYDNNNLKYTITEMNQTYSNRLKNKNNCILLSSLYTLPDYKRKTINYFLRPKNISTSIPRNNTINLNGIQNISTIYPKKNEEKNTTILFSNNNYFDSEISNNKTNTTYNNNSLNSNNYKYKNKKGKYANLELFMKDKFYTDIEERFNKQFKGKKFSHDRSVKDKIIELNQVSEFWGGIFDFTNPIISAKRYQYITRLIEDRKKINEINKKFNNPNLKESNKYYSIFEKKNKKRKMPKLYTVSNLIEKRKKEIKKAKFFDEMRRNKTEEKMKYHLNSLYSDNI